MDKFIKSQLDGILKSREFIAKEAHNIDLRITAIFGYCTGMKSSIQYNLQDKFLAKK